MPGAAEQIAAKEARIAAIASAGQHCGLRYRGRNRHLSAFLGEEPPSAMKLIDQCTSSTAGLGKTYQQLLSGVAHAKAHGLSQFLKGSPPPGQVLIQANIGSAELAQQLLAGPMCASTLVEHLRWYAGWDAADLSPLVTRMLHTWVDIAGLQAAWVGER